MSSRYSDLLGALPTAEASLMARLSHAKEPKDRQEATSCSPAYRTNKSLIRNAGLSQMQTSPKWGWLPFGSL